MIAWVNLGLWSKRSQYKYVMTAIAYLPLFK
jgi:hypothetical protein